MPEGCLQGHADCHRARYASHAIQPTPWQLRQRWHCTVLCHERTCVVSGRLLHRQALLDGQNLVGRHRHLHIHWQTGRL